MEQRILDKIRYEYEAFYLGMLGSSRENIYANAEQIAKKRAISQEIEKITDTFTEAQSSLLLSRPNLLDSIYLYMQEYGKENAGDANVIQAFLRLILTGKEKLN